MKTQKINDYINLVDKSLAYSSQKKSNMDPSVFGLEGMSTPEFRCFLNNLCSYGESSYLEIGTFKGSTSCAAMSNNPRLTSFLIDNFSQFDTDGSVGRALAANIEKYKASTKSVSFINADCFAADKSLITSKIDFYFYDGGHTREDHRRAITDFFENMNDVFVLIVDDYNWFDVSEGTRDGLNLLKDKFSIEKEWTFLTPANFSPVWHNGTYIAVISKKEGSI